MNPRPGQAVLAAALAAAFGVYALRGWFARFTADDYCTAGLQRAAGFVGAQLYWYENWSGRFSYYFTIALVELLGTWTTQVVPTLAMLTFVGASGWAVYPLARWQRWPHARSTSVLLGAAFVLVCLQGAPDVDQSLLWQTGMFTYVFPLVLLMVYVGWLARRVWRTHTPRSRRGLVLSCMLLFFVAGLSETSTAIQVTLLGLGTFGAALFVRGPRRWPLTRLLAIGFLASLIGAIVVVIAPGNYLHELRVTGTVHGIGELPDALKAGVDFVGLFARAVQFRARAAVLVLLVLAGVCGLNTARVSPGARARHDLVRRLWAFPAIVGAAWLLLLAAIVPGYFAQRWDVPERAQIVGVWVVAGAVALVGYALGELVGQVARHVALPLEWRLAHPGGNIVLIVLACVILTVIPGIVAGIPSDAAYAAAWDQLDATIRSRGADGDAVVVDHTLPRHFNFEFLTADPGLYPNPCVAQFYGIPSIVVNP
ncbi:MAG: hypothetical protein NVSMB2_26680 [Chloroflexota bacterium]